MSNLTKYYRKPKAFITLPSKSAMYNFSSDEKSMMDEIGVLRMTMMNQLTTNNPESLINGSAVEELIRDCTTVKGIEPRDMLKCDVDALIMAIRMVSIDETMDISMPCPKCETEQTFGVDLQGMLSAMTYHEEMPYKVPLPTSPEIILHIVPSSLNTSINIDQTYFQDAKEVEFIRRSMAKKTSDVNKTEEELEKLSEEMKNYVNQVHEIQKRMTFSTLNMYAECILYVEMPEGTVDDKKEILDLVASFCKEDHDALKSKLTEINSIGVPKTQNFTCQTCEHVFEAPVEVNPTDFFGNGSR